MGIARRNKVQSFQLLTVPTNGDDDESIASSSSSDEAIDLDELVIIAMNLHYDDEEEKIPLLLEKYGLTEDQEELFNVKMDQQWQEVDADFNEYKALVDELKAEMAELQKMFDDYLLEQLEEEKEWEEEVRKNEEKEKEREEERKAFKKEMEEMRRVLRDLTWRYIYI